MATVTVCDVVRCGRTVFTEYPGHVDLNKGNYEIFDGSGKNLYRIRADLCEGHYEQVRSYLEGLINGN